MPQAQYVIWAPTRGPLIGADTSIGGLQERQILHALCSACIYTLFCSYYLHTVLRMHASVKGGGYAKLSGRVALAVIAPPKTSSCIMET